MGEVVSSRYLEDPTSPIPSHSVVIIMFKSVPVHQVSAVLTIAL